MMKTTPAMIVESKIIPFDCISLDNGATLAPVEVAYESYGELNANRTNAILVLHAFSGDAHSKMLRAIRALKRLDLQIDIVPRFYEAVGPNVGMHRLESLPPGLTVGLDALL